MGLRGSSILLGFPLYTIPKHRGSLAENIDTSIMYISFLDK